MNHDVESERLLERVRPYEVDFLYKYRQIDSRGLERTITHNEIFLPDPTFLNDPFDCRPFITIHKSKSKKKEFYEFIVKSRFPNATKNEIKKEVKKNLRSKTLDNRIHLEERLLKFIKSFGIYCLTEIADDLLMWAHYSDSHRGICLQFDTAKDLSIFWEAYKITYQENYPIVNVMDMGTYDQFFNLFATKSTHWEYEQERRAIKVPGEGGSKTYTFEPELLTGVILGAKISSIDEKIVLEWISQRETPTKIYRAKINNKSYRIDIKGINC